MPVRVSVFDSHPVIQRGLTQLLPAHGFIVVSQSFDGHEAVQQIHKATPDIVLTDSHLPNDPSLKILEAIHQAELTCRSIVYSQTVNPTLVARSVVWGAVDFVVKTEPNQHLIDSLKKSVSDQDSVPSTTFQDIKNRMRKRNFAEVDNPHSLTQREFQVLVHLGFGLSNREIAMSLKISVETAKEHVQNILRKQDFNDRTQAAVAAVRLGLA